MRKNQWKWDWIIGTSKIIIEIPLAEKHDEDTIEIWVLENVQCDAEQCFIAMLELKCSCNKLSYITTVKENKICHTKAIITITSSSSSTMRLLHTKIKDFIQRLSLKDQFFDSIFKYMLKHAHTRQVLSLNAEKLTLSVLWNWSPFILDVSKSYADGTELPHLLLWTI